MKRKFTRLMAALALLVFMAPSMVGWGQTRAEEGYSTCLFGIGHGTSSNYTSTWTTTNGGFSWEVANGNTNYQSSTGTSWDYVKFGRKNNASVGSITTAGENGCYSEAITKVELTIDALTVSKINSIKLYTSTDNSSWTEAGSFTKATGVQTVSLSNPTANLYYKIEFDCASGSSNGLIQVSKVEYYYDNPGGTPTVDAPSFNPAEGTYTTAQSVSISCATSGATIYYTTDGTTPTSSSSVYSTPLNISQTTTVKAIATLQGYNDSPVATATYTIETPSFNQDWEGTMHGWTFVSVTGSQEWSVAGNSSNHYAKMSGYANSSSNANVDWCISPAFDLGDYSNPILTFETAKNYTGNDLEVYFSNDYDGEDPTSATWTALTCTLSPGGSWTFYESGDIDLSSFSGSNCYIGFKYTSTSSEAATWEVDNIELEDRQIVVTHSLTFSADPAAGGSISVGSNLTSPATVAEGDQLAIEATANTGYTFSGWVVSGTGASVANANNASTTFTMGTADATLTANFSAIQTYTVTYHANGPTGVADVQRLTMQVQRLSWLPTHSTMPAMPSPSGTLLLLARALTICPPPQSPTSKPISTCMHNGR